MTARDITRVRDAVIFNIAIGNVDAHAKNDAILIRPRQVELAPLYDLMSRLGCANITQNHAQDTGGKNRGRHILSRATGGAWPKRAAWPGPPRFAACMRSPTGSRTRWPPPRMRSERCLQAPVRCLTSSQPRSRQGRSSSPPTRWCWRAGRSRRPSDDGCPLGWLSRRMRARRTADSAHLFRRKLNRSAADEAGRRQPLQRRDAPLLARRASGGDERPLSKSRIRQTASSAMNRRGYRQRPGSGRDGGTGDS